jgi:hypothetical protein
MVKSSSATDKWPFAPSASNLDGVVRSSASDTTSKAAHTTSKAALIAVPE